MQRVACALDFREYFLCARSMGSLLSSNQGELEDEEHMTTTTILLVRLNYASSVCHHVNAQDHRMTTKHSPFAPIALAEINCQIIPRQKYAPIRNEILAFIKAI